MKQGGWKVVEDTMRGRIVGWMNEVLREESFKFEYVDVQLEIEYPDGKKKKFPDIIIWENRNQKIAACLIEYKLPFGWFPYDPVLIEDAQTKAMNAPKQIPFFGTWNTNELVLWETFDREAESLIDRRKARYDVCKIKTRNDLDDIEIEQNVKNIARIFFRDLENFYFNKQKIPKIPIDEFFIYNIRSVVDSFDYSISEEIRLLSRKDIRFRHKLIRWYLEQGWTRPTRDEDYNKTARQFLYLIIDKIIFYNTLKLKYKNMTPIMIADSVKVGSMLKQKLQEYFTTAEQISGDYETIFGENFIEQIPIPNIIVKRFKVFTNNFTKYDFSKLGYKDIGRVFDTLIPDDERHKLGQYYTRSDVVDLIVGFCVKLNNDLVADFGCGAGTFLLRAYARLNYFKPKEHTKLLHQIIGVDIAKFPAHLSMINLAGRDLSVSENYPKILCKDFFDIEVDKKYYYGPKCKLIKNQSEEEEIFPSLDAVIGNPPYTRQEEIEAYIPDYKIRIENTLKKDWGNNIVFNKKAGIYVYFFIHGIKFLKEEGRFGYVTSNSWLDADYGVFLQLFLLQKTKILAIIDSKVEKWFKDADINTAIIILEKCDNTVEREKTIVKFVQLKCPIDQLIYPTDSEKERWKTIDNLIEFIEAKDKFYEDEKIKIYPKNQKDLFTEGLDKIDGHYKGTKWSRYIRAPQVYYKRLEKNHFFIKFQNMTNNIRYGLKTGAESFFYFDKEKTKLWGIPKTYLKPILTSPQQLNSIIISDAPTQILWIKNTNINDVANENVKKYIIFGEEQEYNKRESLKNKKFWYSYYGLNPWKIIIPRLMGDRFSIFYNKIDAVVDDSFTEIDIDKIELMAYLNSTVSYLLLELSGEVSLGQGALFLSSNDIRDMDVLDFNKYVNNGLRKKLKKAFNQLSKRNFGSIFEELGANSPEEFNLNNIKPDRRKLDKIIMSQIMGLSKADQIAIYKGLIDLVKYRIIRALSTKKEKKYRGADIDALAEAILLDLYENINSDAIKFPGTYVENMKCRAIEIPSGDPEIVNNLWGLRIKIGKEEIKCNSYDEAEYLFYCAKNKINLCNIPILHTEIKKVLKLYSKIYNKFIRSLYELLGTIPDLKIKEKVRNRVLTMVFIKNDN